MTTEVLAKWTAEQLELSQKVVLGDEHLGFAVPPHKTIAIPPPPSPSPSRSPAGKTTAPVMNTSDEWADSEKKQQRLKKTCNGGDSASASFVGASAKAKTPIPLIPSGVQLCVAETDTKKAAAADSTASSSLPPLSVVAGIDISFVKDSDLAVASLVLLSFPALEVLHTTMHHVKMTEPYIPGFLAFREVPLVTPLIDEVLKTLPKDLHPQLIFVDGNGVHHPRKCGFASHLGVVCGIPTIGCAKNLLAVDDLSNHTISAMVHQFVHDEKKGPIMPLISYYYGGDRDGDDAKAADRTPTMWGYAALTGNSTKNPIFVSPGHKISFQTAMALTVAVTLFRVPEPIRQADLQSRAYIKKHFDQ